LRKGGTSLLPKGLAGVEGRWEPGDLIEIKDSSGTLVGRGIVSYSSDDCEALKGQATARIEAMLGHKNGDELVHVDNLVLAENMDNNG